ncbi:MAG TPA: MFS transporter [Actinomycetota bacterium]|jgi:MFS family permease
MRRNIRDLPRPAWFLVAGHFVNWFASFAIVFLVLYLTKRGYSFAAAGTAVAVYGIGEMLTGGLAGHLADRIGRRSTMAISMFASAAATLALYFVHTYAAILVVAFLAGMATEGWRPASRALMADVVPEGQRVTAFALVRLAGNLGIAGGSAVAGFLADRSFLWVFVTDAATSAVFGALVLVALPAGRVTHRAEERELGGYRIILADRAFVMFLLSSAVISFVYFQGQSASLPLHVVRISHLQPSDFGLLLALNGLLVALLELPISSITMHRPPKAMIALGFLLVGLGFGLTAAAHTLPSLLFTVAIWTLGEMVAAPVGYAYVADIAPDHLRGRYQGLYGVFWGTGSVTGPAIGTWLLAQSVTGFWFLCGVLGLVAALVVLAGRPAYRPRHAIMVPHSEPAIVAPVPEDSSVQL